MKIKNNSEIKNFWNFNSIEYEVFQACQESKIPDHHQERMFLRFKFSQEKEGI